MRAYKWVYFSILSIINYFQLLYCALKASGPGGGGGDQRDQIARAVAGGGRVALDHLLAQSEHSLAGRRRARQFQRGCEHCARRRQRQTNYQTHLWATATHLRGSAVPHGTFYVVRGITTPFKYWLQVYPSDSTSSLDKYLYKFEYICWLNAKLRKQWFDYNSNH